MVVAMIVSMIMPVVMVVIMVMVLVIITFEKIRLDIENAIEIEGVASQHFHKRDLATLGPVQPRIGIDAADARLDLGQFAGCHEIGLVEQGSLAGTEVAGEYRDGNLVGHRCSFWPVT